MAVQRTVIRLMVDGMTCSNCEQRIEKAVRALQGVRRVSASASLSEVTVYFDAGLVDRDMIVAAIVAAGYQVRDESAAALSPQAAGDAAAGRSKTGSLYRFLGLIAVVAAIYLIIRYTVGFTFLPAVTQSMGYGLIFVVGLLTSLHCIAMCGGIVLSQGIKRNEAEGEAPSCTPGSMQHPPALTRPGLDLARVSSIMGAGSSPTRSSEESWAPWARCSASPRL